MSWLGFLWFFTTKSPVKLPNRHMFPTGLLGPSNCARWAERVIRFFLASLGLECFSEMSDLFSAQNPHRKTLNLLDFFTSSFVFFVISMFWAGISFEASDCILENNGAFASFPGTKDPWWAALLQHWYLEILDELSTRAEWVCITCIREKVPCSPGAFVWPTVDATVPWLMGEWEVNQTTWFQGWFLFKYRCGPYSIYIYMCIYISKSNPLLTPNQKLSFSLEFQEEWWSDLDLGWIPILWKSFKLWRMKCLGMEVGAITPHVCPWNKSRLPGHSQMAQEDLKNV